jgi:hypothetical protein
MACECFDEGRLARCRAVAGTLIPSHYERETYCRSDDNRRCPTYRLFQLRRAPLTEELYYNLWMPPVEAREDDTEPVVRAFG